ncbi:valine--tRNA ligase [Tranquillimonas alkanivorans]|uniref:Valine--tRNA ligase n=1 Tax=Tranquillimonas alkanivorans TaxID=441119 RepID=A0A1I5MAZ8_9RHOB|nr:valine--tRNA ligase [Tranquillimonas alkanivorans]SFP06663.1 valyl-tRNA synthetase [Tranquillimonas alkanivorans]
MPMEKTFNAAEAEPRIYAEWEKADAFAAGANAAPGAETFCIMLPPPNVTGFLHAGHAFNHTLMDILVRWHRMRGHDTLWQPGLDHAGIATQLVVERELARTQQPGRRELGREKFLEKVHEWKERSGGMIVQQDKRLGASMDWSREAFTMDGQFHDAVIRVFVDMYDKGMIYRGKRLVNWDPHFETAISDLEVEQVEVDGHMWRLRYQLENGETFEYVEKDEDGNETLRETRDYITVATTRPETMLGDTGVAVHPDDARYAHLIGKTVRLPLVGRSIPIVADSYADPTKGTGAVKITPAHDFNDWEVGKRAELRAINVMNPDASMWLKDNPAFAEGCDAKALANVVQMLDGVDRYEARDAIVTAARDDGWLDGIDTDRHAVPHGDRSKVAIEPYLTDQWFVDTAKIVGPALDAVRNGETKIIPESGEKVYYHWLENIEPWCISRQLWWGHRIPVWYGPTLTDGAIDADAGWTAFCAPTQDEAFAKMAEYYGHEDLKVVTDQREAEELLIAAIGEVRDEGAIRTPEAPTALPVYRDPDVLDTWFSSGLWPIGTLGWPQPNEAYEKYFPTDVLVTGQDILFFWVARMMMMQYAVVGQKPFHTVYLHGLVRDEKGVKMSKVLGNVIDPIELIEEYGADALRFANCAMAALGGTLKLSRDNIKGYRNFGTKLWNAFRFAEMNGVFEGRTGSATIPAPQATVNKWIVGETAKVREEVDAALEAYRFNDAASALYGFVWGVVCDWYLELAKPLFNSDDEAAIAETRETMAWVLDQCLILMHPIMPFITEELWGQTATRNKMLVHAEWPTYTARDLVDAGADAEMNWVIGMIEAVRSVRGEMNVPAGMKVPLLQLELDDAGRNAFARNESLILRLARIDSVTEAESAPKGAATIPVTGGTFALPLADIIDVGAEKARLEKQLQKLGKELGGLKGRLSNPKFVESAPEEVVEETRELARDKEAEEVRLKAALERLAEVG